MNKNEILQQLNKNRAKNISIIGIIENYGIESILKYGDSLLITVKTDNLWSYLAAENKEDLKKLLKNFQYRTPYFASLESWMIPIVSLNREIEWELRTERLILPKTAELNVEPDNLKAKKLFYSLGFEFDRVINWIKLKEK